VTNAHHPAPRRVNQLLISGVASQRSLYFKFWPWWPKSFIYGTGRRMTGCSNVSKQLNNFSHFQKMTLADYRTQVSNCSVNVRPIEARRLSLDPEKPIIVSSGVLSLFSLVIQNFVKVWARERASRKGYPSKVVFALAGIFVAVSNAFSAKNSS